MDRLDAQRQNSQAAKQTAKTLLQKPLHWVNNSASTARRPWSSLTAAAKAVTALCLTSKKSSRKTSNTGFNLHKGRSTRPFFHVARHQLPSDGLDTDKYKKGRVQHVLFPFTLQVEFFNYFQVFIQFVHQRLTGWDFQAHNVFVGNAFDVFGQRTQGVAVCRNQYTFAAQDGRSNLVFPERQDALEVTLRFSPSGTTSLGRLA